MRIRCTGELVGGRRCGNTLGELYGDYFVAHHAGRRWVARYIMAICCEVCGTAWQPPDPVEAAPPRRTDLATVAGPLG